MNSPVQTVASLSPPPSPLTFPFDRPPQPGTWQAVADGVYWLRMPLPFALDHINLWVLRDRDGWTLVDTGINTDITRELWGQLIEHAFAGLPVRRIIVTHFHPDHMGLAGWLVERFGVELWMTEAEYLTAANVYADLPGMTRESSVRFFALHGLDLDRQDALRQQTHSYRRAVSEPPQAFHRMQDGDVLDIDGRDWQIIVGYGHAPEHAALYCAALGTLIAGDMVLPKISTNVSVWSREPEGDPVEQFLRSIERYAQLPAESLILPSHGLPFHGLRQRVAALTEHHRLRLNELAAACEQPVSAADVLPVLFRRALDTHQISFAMGEAIAHLNHLMFKRRVVRDMDSHGVLRFHATSSHN